MKNKQTAGSFGVIGLGRFGTALAITLSEAGKDVIAIDRDEDKVKAIRQYTDYALPVPVRSLSQPQDDIPALLKAVKSPEPPVSAESLQIKIPSSVPCDTPGLPSNLPPVQTSVETVPMQRDAQDCEVLILPPPAVRIPHRRLPVSRHGYNIFPYQIEFHPYQTKTLSYFFPYLFSDNSQVQMYILLLESKMHSGHSLLADFFNLHILRQNQAENNCYYKYNCHAVCRKYIFDDLWKNIPDFHFTGGCKPDADSK